MKSAKILAALLSDAEVACGHGRRSMGFMGRTCLIICVLFSPVTSWFLHGEIHHVLLVLLWREVSEWMKWEREHQCSLFSASWYAKIDVRSPSYILLQSSMPSTMPPQIQWNETSLPMDQNKILLLFSCFFFFFFDKGGRNIWKKADVCHENNDTQAEGPLSHESVGTQMANGKCSVKWSCALSARNEKKENRG